MLSHRNTENAFFDNEHHWVMFIRNACFIKLFGVSAIIEFSEKDSSYLESKGVVYKFCYKTTTHSKLTLLEQISLTSQGTLTA